MHESKFDFRLNTARGPGDTGDEGTNPEQLFATTHSGWFLGAQNKIAIPADVSLNGRVGVGSIRVGFDIDVGLKGSLPGISSDGGQSVVDKAQVVRAYSSATRSKVDCMLTQNAAG